FKADKQQRILDQINRLKDAAASPKNAQKANKKIQEALALEEAIPKTGVESIDLAIERTVRQQETKVNELWDKTGKNKDGSVYNIRRNQVEAAMQLLSDKHAFVTLTTAGGTT